jgi:TRAP-type C4-dicarboxylate transport system substrate-binding protein
MTRFPINSMADLKGKKIRSTGAHAKIAAAQGASPAFVVGAEQYMALQRGTIDGTLYSPLGGVSYKLFEVVKYVSLPAMFVSPAMSYLVNLEAWNSLPKEYQNILQEEANNLARISHLEFGPILDKLAVDEGRKRYGAEFIQLSDKEIARFQEAVRPMWNKWAAESGSGAKLVNIIKKVSGLK